DVLAANYGAGLRLMDFVADPEPARITINDWVSDQTEEKIKDLIPQGAIDSSTRLVLANAIYFYADWLYQFDPNFTHDAPFTSLDGEEITVPMMSQLSRFLYSQGEGYQAVEMAYIGDNADMTIIVPDFGEFDDFEAALSAAQIEEIIANLEYKQVDLSLPKFTYESDFSLAQTLIEMGMPDAFGNADFSGMDGTTNLFISDVFHKAFVAVDEEGTEAAAATAVIIAESAMPMVDATLSVDRPFIYLIRDIDSGSILFMGRVLNPAT
ncbi:MAG: serpin family protein, partial [Planctomycetes bacterium]|nr:serpin family protein [Planctomycetota bacterium]